MKTKIFRNPSQALSSVQVLEKFTTELQEFPNVFSESEIELLAEAYAKNPVDKFIITEPLQVEAAQGDILIWAKGSNQFKNNIGTVKNLKKTNRMVLQEGDSMTGDHRIVTLEGSNYVLKEGIFHPAILANADLLHNRQYRCLIFKTDSPFLLVHREHGNYALPADEYMFCTALNPEKMTRMLD